MVEVTFAERFLSLVLPSLGGFIGASLLYFGIMMWIGWQQKKRLERLERRVELVVGMLIALSRSSEKLEKKDGEQ